MIYERTPFDRENYWVVGDNPFMEEITTYSFKLRFSAISVARRMKSGGFWRVKLLK